MGIRQLNESASLQEFTIAQPAAGAEFSFTVPTGLAYRFETMFVQFNTSATVANRFVKIDITDGTNIVWEGGGQAAVVASSGYRIGFQRLGGQAAASGAGVPNIAALPDIWLPAGYVLKSLTSAIDPADQYLAVRGIVAVSSAAAFE